VIAETWEYSDERSGQSTIVNGSLAGTPLRELVEREPEWLVGDGWSGPHYPLLGKFLDASHQLPVHVHGDDEAARAMPGEANGKTEAWHILWVADEENASVLAGLKPGVTLNDVRQAALDRDYDRIMQRRRIAPGDTVYVPGGTLHTFGPGTLVFEIQQTSDIGVDVMPTDIYGTPLDEATWHRRIEETLGQLHLEPQPIPTHGLARFDGHNRRTVCAAGPYFAMERWKITTPLTLPLPAGRGVAITNLVNPVGVSWEGGTDVIRRAESRVIPAAMRQVTLVPDGIAYVLVCYVPDLLTDIVTPLLEAGYGDDEIRALGDLSSVLPIAP
jgi:mannose-6-phosphate isomerase